MELQYAPTLEYNPDEKAKPLFEMLTKLFSDYNKPVHRYPFKGKRIRQYHFNAYVHYRTIEFGRYRKVLYSLINNTTVNRKMRNLALRSMKDSRSMRSMSI